MPDVTMIESRSRRAMPFWAGFAIGVAFMLIAVVVFWFLGLVDIFPASDNSANVVNTTTEVNNSSNIANETNNSSDSNEANSLSNNLSNSDNNTANSLDNAAKSTTSSTTSTSASVKVEGGTLTLAKNVDQHANPVDPTTKFTTDDDRIYIVFDITDAKKYASAKLKIEWSNEGGSLSHFDYDLPSGQSAVYFYQNNAGVGDYTVKLSADGTEVGTMSFSVSK